jgi:hypothetical protein
MTLRASPPLLTSPRFPEPHGACAPAAASRRGRFERKNSALMLSPEVTMAMGKSVGMQEDAVKKKVTPVASVTALQAA